MSSRATDTRTFSLSLTLLAVAAQRKDEQGIKLPRKNLVIMSSRQIVEKAEAEREQDGRQSSPSACCPGSHDGLLACIYQGPFKVQVLMQSACPDFHSCRPSRSLRRSPSPYPGVQKLDRAHRGQAYC